MTGARRQTRPVGNPRGLTLCQSFYKLRQAQLGTTTDLVENTGLADRGAEPAFDLGTWACLNATLRRARVPAALVLAAAPAHAGLMHSTGNQLRFHQLVSRIAYGARFVAPPLDQRGLPRCGPCQGARRAQPWPLLVAWWPCRKPSSAALSLCCSHNSTGNAVQVQLPIMANSTHLSSLLCRHIPLLLAGNERNTAAPSAYATPTCCRLAGHNTAVERATWRGAWALGARRQGPHVTTPDRAANMWLGQCPAGRVAALRADCMRPSVAHIHGMWELLLLALAGVSAGQQGASSRGQVRTAAAPVHRAGRCPARHAPPIAQKLRNPVSDYVKTAQCTCSRAMTSARDQWRAAVPQRAGCRSTLGSPRKSVSVTCAFPCRLRKPRHRVSIANPLVQTTLSATMAAARLITLFLLIAAAAARCAEASGAARPSLARQPRCAPARCEQCPAPVLPPRARAPASAAPGWHWPCERRGEEGWPAAASRHRPKLSRPLALPASRGSERIAAAVSAAFRDTLPPAPPAPPTQAPLYGTRTLSRPPRAAGRAPHARARPFPPDRH